MIVKHKIDNREVDALMKRLDRSMRNLDEPLRDIGDVLENSIMENFDVGGRPRKWPDLSKVTKRARAKKGKWPGKIGQVSGQLVNSIAAQPPRGLSVKVTHGKEYGDHFHYGTQQKVTKKQQKWLGLNLGMWRRVGDTIKNPPRPFMVIQDEDVKEAEVILIDHLRRAIKGVR